MVGWKYSPLFPYFTEQFSDRFQIIGADYVEAGEGTGLVHQSPAFGQEDYDAAVAAGFISPQRLPPCPVDDKGQGKGQLRRVDEVFECWYVTLSSFSMFMVT